MIVSLYRKPFFLDDSGTGILRIGLFSLVLIGITLLVFSAGVIAQDPTSNQLPNPQFRGTNGFVETGGGTGTVTAAAIPTLWRAFAVSGGDISVDIVPLAADAIFAGSLATNAVQMTVDTFGDDQGFDNEVVRIPVNPMSWSLWGEVYMRSANIDSSSQVVTVSLNTFDNTPAFLGGQTLVATATSSWGYFGTLSYQNLNAATADMAFRLAESGPNNSILIAIPRINGMPELRFSDGFEANPK